MQAGTVAIPHGAMAQSLSNEETRARMLRSHSTSSSKRRHGIQTVGHEEDGSGGTARQRSLLLGRRRSRRRGEGALEDPVGAEVEVPRIARHADVGPVRAVDGRRADLAANVAPPPRRIMARDVVAVGAEHARAGFLEEALRTAVSGTGVPESGDLADEEPLDKGRRVAPHGVVDGLCVAPEGVARPVEGLAEHFADVLAADGDDGVGVTDCGDWLLVEFRQPFVEAAFDCRVVVAGEGAVRGTSQLTAAEETIGQLIGVFEVRQPALKDSIFILAKVFQIKRLSSSNVRVLKSNHLH